LKHCTLNIALYGPRRRWAMTERGSATRIADTLAIGPSSLRWDGGQLIIDIDERGMPLPFPVRGQVRVHPQAVTGACFTLDAAGAHRWSPLAPRSHVEVELASPGLRWSGPGYFDSNDGDGPLERSFADWTWSRASLGESTVILYDINPGANLALLIDRSGAVTHVPAPPAVTLSRTGWRMARTTRADGGQAGIEKTLEDSPFYARSVVRTRLLGEATTAMHESLSLQRFRSPVVQAMLPFRMPRWR
jgi:carotenoid 1,2-hydratase